MATKLRSSDVFINCPFDPSYVRLTQGGSVNLPVDIGRPSSKPRPECARTELPDPKLPEGKVSEFCVAHGRMIHVRRAAHSLPKFALTRDPLTRTARQGAMHGIRFTGYDRKKSA